jgi:hypothetical protein
METHIDLLGLAELIVGLLALVNQAGVDDGHEETTTRRWVQSGSAFSKSVDFMGSITFINQ